MSFAHNSHYVKLTSQPPRGLNPRWSLLYNKGFTMTKQELYEEKDRLVILLDYVKEQEQRVLTQLIEINEQIMALNKKEQKKHLRTVD